MKIGLVFKKQFQDEYGAKVEIRADEMTIRRTQAESNFGEACEVFEIIRKSNQTITGFITDQFPVDTIQLIYLGEWNI